MDKGEETDPYGEPLIKIYRKTGLTFSGNYHYDGSIFVIRDRKTRVWTKTAGYRMDQGGKLFFPGGHTSHLDENFQANGTNCDVKFEKEW